jgi:predicted nucleic acid-binding protein
MGHLVDTNILLRSVDQTHAMHRDAVAALKTLLGSGEIVCFTPQNIIGFWNACTRPQDRNGLGLSPSEADTEASRLEALLTLLPDNPSIYPEWRRLVVGYGVSGVQVHDARLVAAMNVYNVESILTFNNRDFARYTSIHCVHPRDVLRRDPIVG